MQPISKLLTPAAKPDPWRPGSPAGEATSVLTEKCVAIGGESDLVEARRAMRELAADVGFPDSGCVLLTLVLQGTTAEPLVRRLGIEVVDEAPRDPR